MAKYVHIIINSAYTAPYIDLVRINFNFTEHVFFVIRGWDQAKTPIPDFDNVYSINDRSNILNGFKLLRELNLSSKIFLHGIYSPYLLMLLFVQPWLLNKCNWIIWGADLYQYCELKDSFRKKAEELIRKRVFAKIAVISTIIKGDYILAKKWYGVKGVYQPTMYSVPLKTDEISKIVTGNKVEKSKALSVLIGNSSDPGNHHFEILDFLRPYVNENINIYALLNYGDQTYAETVIARGRSIFGSKFHGVREYKSFKDFVLFMDSMDVIVFNHKRQQALGNLWLAFYLRKKVFLNRQSTLFDFFRNQLQVSIGDTATIASMDYADFSNIDNNILQENKAIVEQVIKQEYAVELWDAIFNKQ